MKFTSALTALIAATSVIAAPAIPRRGIEIGDTQITFVDQIASPVGANFNVNFKGYVTKTVSQSTVETVFRLLAFLFPGEQDSEILDERIKLFTRVGLPLTQVDVSLPLGSGATSTVNVGRTDQTGKFSVAKVLDLTAADETDGLIEFTANGFSPAQTIGGRTFVLKANGVSVFSDIDDTIKFSEVNSKTKLLEHTFLRPFTAVPGMASLYQKINSELSAKNLNPTFHYLSRSPWNLFAPLAQLLKDNLFPQGQFILRDLSAFDLSLIKFITEGADYKTDRIKEFFALFPTRKLILIGDSTEQDPESYAAAYKLSPNSITCIAIRIVTGVDAKKEAGQIAPSRFENTFAGIPRSKWITFTDPSQIDAAFLANGNCRK
ncbi:uncharacterized protein EV422DRAFT_539373 [Fimicolochytrium jonesii]|uniref:uncharacterized protein n=1 Tax=Fimicolochytrium jonesii TaxID=1396493 RepID=UPI0022FED536|nr:uncharacterized protein EV422DRAFT_539373 [Fimicolochytrium jonesii]KAI8817927.1 hypothetical protein EV422DRAFT_539373 [Fimicolochytrium jonesii]